MSSPSSQALIEISFPDRSVSRYSLDRARELLGTQKVGSDWPARVAGTEEWHHLSTLLVDGDGRANASGPNGTAVTVPAALVSEAISGLAPERAFFPAGPAAGRANESETTSGAPARTFGADEPVIASLGQRGLVGFLKGDGVSSTQVVLTPKRIYVRGRAITRSSSEEMRMIGDLPGICSLSLHNYSNWPKLGLGLFLVFIAIILGSSRGATEKISATVAFFLATWMLISFFMTRRRYLRINMGGTPYDVSMEGVNDEQVLKFMDTSMAYISDPAHPAPSTLAAEL